MGRCDIDSQPRFRPVVFVVDDDEQVSQSIRHLLESVGLHVSCYQAGEEFLEAFDDETFGCVITDVRMPGMNGLELQRELVERGCRMPIIVITAYGDIRTAVDSLKAGAVDFIEKPYRPHVLLDSVQQALLREKTRYRTDYELTDISRRLNSLTDRERQVLDRIVDGKPTKTIAWELDVGLTTVDYHRNNLLRKMGVDTIVELARAIERLRLMKVT